MHFSASTLYLVTYFTNFLQWNIFALYLVQIKIISKENGSGIAGAIFDEFHPLFITQFVIFSYKFNAHFSWIDLLVFRKVDIYADEYLNI